MASRYTLDTLDPTKKQYADMTREEANMVRLQAEEAADKFIQQHRQKSLFLRIAGMKISAAGKALEPPTPEPTSGDWDD